MQKARKEGVFEIAGRGAAVLSAVEVGLGSVLHGFKVPLTGYFLSLNQAFLLSRFTLGARGEIGARARLIPLQVSSVSALLKSLAPAGKKLTPMLAISAQGLCFTLGTALLGANPVGVALGSALLSAWAFIQPAMIYYVIFGNPLIEAVGVMHARLSETFGLPPEGWWGVFAAIVGFKALLAVGASVLAWKLPETVFEDYANSMLRRGKNSALKPSRGDGERGAWDHARLAARDLLQPLFLISLLLTGLCFAFVEGAGVKWIWAMLRPLAAGFVVFWLIRVMPMESLAQKWTASPRWAGMGRSFQVALEALRKSE